MAFKTVSDLSTDNAVALGGENRKTGKKNPTTITGYFIGSKEVVSPKSKTGKANLHVFQTEEGNVGVWGKTDLDQKLRGAQIGALTRVTFTGMQETKNNPMYKYKVEVDGDNTIEVSDSLNTPNFAAEEEDTGGYGDDSEDDVDAEASFHATTPRTPARTPSPEAQARVQALLNKRK